jgi:hypothetical protein
MNKGKARQIDEMCLQIFAHAECDYEVNLSGNGVNACEASAVAWALLDILHGDGRAWQDAHEGEVSAIADELRREAGEE